MLFEASHKQETNRTNWVLRIVEAILFNVAIFVCIKFIGNTTEGVTILQIVAF